MIRPLADAAAILLIVETCILGLVPLALLGGMAYGVIRLIDALRPILKRAQEVSARIARQSAEVSDKIARPLIEVSSRAAAAQAWMDRMGEPVSTEAEWTGNRKS
jgi:hypothetical protein